MDCRKSDNWEILSTDVLVVGGGFGGLWAALRAAECGSSVILADKSFAGKSGHSYFAGGARMVLLPEDDLNAYLRDMVLGNDWLVDQRMVCSVFQESFDRLKDMESFGFSFRKSYGKYIWTKARGTRNIKNLWPQHGTAAEEVSLLRKVALSRGVHIMNHVYIYDLIKAEDGAIAGAVAIGVRSPAHYLLQAKSTILATNSGGYRGHHLASELQGTGPFMAYDAGAEIINPEFHYINIRPARHEIEGSGIMPAVGARWVNAKGDHFMEAYDPELKDRAPVFKIVVAAAKEAIKGNAPISMDVENMSEEERETFRTLQVSHGWMPILFEKCERYEGYDPLKQNIEWQPAYESNKLGIRCDVHCRTGLEGLFAAGMARDLGINSFTGWSIAACTWSGYRAGESAGRYAGERDVKKVVYSSLSEKKESFLLPLTYNEGSEPETLVRELQKILFPVDALIIMSEKNLQSALSRVMLLKEEKLSSLKAIDVRTLIKAREARTMMLSAEMALKAAIMRMETRPNIFYREDFPNTDNEHWLKWIIVRKGREDEPEFLTEDIPFETYPLRP